MIVVGDQYNTAESCSIEGVSKVLEVMGGLLLFIAILYIMVGLSFCAGVECSTGVDCGTICTIASCPIIVVTCLAQFGVQIWASVVVFGKSLTQSTLSLYHKTSSIRCLGLFFSYPTVRLIKLRYDTFDFSCFYVISLLWSLPGPSLGPK